MPEITIVANTDPNFDPDWLRFIDHDPIHPIDSFKNLERRTKSDRKIFVMLVDQIPSAVLETALYDRCPTTADQLWIDPVISEPYTHAVFYSVFRLPDTENVKGMARHLIMESAKILKKLYTTLTTFITFSPIPSLSKKLDDVKEKEQVWNYINSGQDPVAKFHTNNGATPYKVWPNADTSNLRQQESWGWMASYCYTV